MGIVIHGVNAPLITRAMVLSVQNAVHNWVAQVEVRRCHVDFSPQRARAIWKFTGTHAPEKIQIFLHRAVTVGALPTWLGERAAVFTHLVWG